MPEFLDRAVDAVVKLDDGAVGPELPANFFASHNFASALQQHQKNLERLFLQADGFAAGPQLAGAQIEFKLSNPHT